MRSVSLLARLCTASVLVAAAAALFVGGRAGAQDVYQIPPDTPAHIRRAVGSPARPAEQRERDVNRKPAEVLTLVGLEEGDHVIEIASFGHYYTTMLVEAVGPDGYVDMYDLPYTERFAGEAARAFDDEHDNATYHLQDYNDVQFPQDVDVVLNVLYYHDLKPQGVDTAKFNAKLFDALKPGGAYLVIDHKAEDGSGWRDAATIHRIGVETIIEEVTAAGFELEVDSDLLAHPEDDRSAMVFAPGVRGGTDRAVLLFRKPAR
ncbi:MAG TPA: methyltransferase [Gammaproteobacteria bacterium]